jgi:hypothetical protein
MDYFDDYDGPFFENIIYPNGEGHFREYRRDYTFEFFLQTIDGESVGVCGIDFYRDHPCNWMHNSEIFDDIPAYVMDHLLSDNNDDVRPVEIQLEKFFGYDSRLGGTWVANWNNLTNTERVILMRRRLSDLMNVFDMFLTDDWKNTEIAHGTR